MENKQKSIYANLNKKEIELLIQKEFLNRLETFNFLEYFNNIDTINNKSFFILKNNRVVVDSLLKEDKNKQNKHMTLAKLRENKELNLIKKYKIEDFKFIETFSNENTIIQCTNFQISFIQVLFEKTMTPSKIKFLRKYGKINKLFWDNALNGVFSTLQIKEKNTKKALVDNCFLRNKEEIEKSFQKTNIFIYKDNINSFLKQIEKDISKLETLNIKSNKDDIKLNSNLDDVSLKKENINNLKDNKSNALKLKNKNIDLVVNRNIKLKSLDQILKNNNEHKKHNKIFLDEEIQYKTFYIYKNYLVN